MSGADVPTPVRSCIGCRLRRPQADLVRITRSVDGVVAVDGASAGRGAWLCRDTTGTALVVGTCLDTAIARRAFARAWRGEVHGADEDAIRAAVDRRSDGVDDEDSDVH